MRITQSYHRLVHLRAQYEWKLTPDTIKFLAYRHATMGCAGTDWNGTGDEPCRNETGTDIHSKPVPSLLGQ